MQVAGDPEGRSKLHSCITQCERAGIDAVQAIQRVYGPSLTRVLHNMKGAGIDVVQVAGDPEAYGPSLTRVLHNVKGAGLTQSK
jgi:hypothetical protein